VTVPTASVERPLRRLSPSTIALLALAALAWAGVVAYARHLGNGPGSMGMPLWAFLGMWALMMAAMMLPAVAPVASLYARTIKWERSARLPVFVAGYLIAWAAAGIPAYGALRLVDHLGGQTDAAMRNIAVVVLVGAGIYQFSPLKGRCLRHCRSPLAQLLRYGNVKGPLRDFKVALHHASYCLGCCWALMALFIAFGVMNAWAMLGLAAVVLSEKVLRRGEAIGRVIGALCVVVALLVLASPRVATGVVPKTPSISVGTMRQMGG
jgi:predicted metal-binding membrane protein